MLKEREKRSDRLRRFRSRIRRTTAQDDAVDLADAHTGPAKYGSDSESEPAERFPRTGPALSITPMGRVTGDVEASTAAARPMRRTSTKDLRREPTASSRYMSRTENSGLGGFPMPGQLLGSSVDRFFPSFSQRIGVLLDTGKGTAAGTNDSANLKLERRFTTHPVEPERNSRFRHLTEEQKDELGGVEYRASSLLLKIVIGVRSYLLGHGTLADAQYLLMTPLVAFLIVGPYMSLVPGLAAPLDDQHQRVNTVWFTAFNIWSSFTNCGMSLSDTSMIPFQNAYLLVVGTSASLGISPCGLLIS